jgi:diguanylate cyclase (GGDEF)-like protein
VTPPQPDGPAGSRRRLVQGACRRLAAHVRQNTLPVYVGAFCGSAAVLALTMLAVATTLSVDGWRIALVGTLFLLADRPLLEFRFGHDKEAFTWAEVCVLLGLVLVPLPILVPVAVVGVLAYHCIARHNPVKSLFNGAAVGLGTAVAGATAFAVGGQAAFGAQLDLRQGVALAAAAVTFSIFNGAAVALAVALSEDLRWRDIVRKGLWLRILVDLGNGVVGVGMVALAVWSTPTLVVVPPLLLAMYGAYRGYLHAMQERDLWQQLDSACRELNQLDEAAVAASVTVHAAEMFKADTIEVVVAAAGGRPGTSYAGGADGVRRVRRSDAPGLASEAVGDELTDTSAYMVYTTPLEGAQGQIGLLRLGFRGPVSLTKRERQVLKTFAHSVSSTLQNVALYSEMRHQAETKAHEASHDALTGLGNRVLLHDRAAVALAAADEASQCGLLVIDLDHFKEINDTLGHAAGDVFLQQVAQRILSTVKGADAVCRLGGDEFAVLISDLRTPEQADVVAARLLQVLSQPVGFDGLRLSIEGSVGVACYPADATSFDELLRRADVALYQAKGSRGSVSHYRADRDESSLHRLELAAELRSAMAEDQFVVHYQPQYDLVSASAVGAEALVRWQHPERGLLPPAEFVGAVEHSGLIREFTLMVLEKAVAECAGWASAGPPLTVAVNLSARNLLDSGLPGDVARVLSRHALPAERLVLEITETTMMSELDVVEEVLGTLRGMGVQLSVDDFGTGYSSLAFLQRVAVNEVKIDRTFVAGVSTSESDRALVRATVQLAHSLGARAVGEGVEDEALASALRELGCDFAQGYHLGRPMPAPALRELLGLTTALQRMPVPQPRADAEGRHLRAVANG